MKTWKRSYWFFFAIVLLYWMTLGLHPQIGKSALRFSGQNFIHFLFVLTPVFICIGLMDTWVQRDIMIQIMGDHSGIKGAMIAIVSDMITAVPLYALLPVVGVLLKKGCRIFNVLLFLCSSTSIRIPLLLFEISSLGVRFTLIQLGGNLAVIFAIAFLIEKLLSDQDHKAIDEMNHKQ